MSWNIGSAIGGAIEKGIKTSAKATIKGATAFGVEAAKVTANTATDIGKAVGFGGKGVLYQGLNSPVRLAAHVGGAAALGATLANADGRNDGAAVAGSAALGATALASVPGTAVVGAMGAVGLAGTATGVLGATAALGRASIKTPKQPISLNNLDELKFSAVGVGALVGSSAIEGTKRAIRKYEQIRMGKHDGQMRSSTPVIPQIDRTPSYSNNGGATGDLVFAMYNNR